MQDREKVIEEICKIIEDKKGENIEVFNLKGSDYFVDFVVIATALIDKHALALLDFLKKDLKQKGESFLNIEEENPNWIVADLGILLFIFLQKIKERNLI